MKGLFLSIGLTIALASTALAAPQCHTSEVWKCAEIAIDWLHTLPKRSLPESSDEVDVMCRELTSAVDCALKYRDSCLTPLQKEVQTLVSEGVIDLGKNFCSKEASSRQNYEKHAPCLNKVAHTDEVVNLLQYIMAIVEKAHKVENKDLITYSCCGYRKAYNSLIKLGNDNCGADATNSILDIVKLAVSELPNVVCNGFEGTEPKCSDLLPPEGSKPDADALGIEFYKFLQQVFKQWLE